MCGNHQTGPSGERLAHPAPTGPIFHPRPWLRSATGAAGGVGATVRSRRAFLGEVGRGTLALAVVTPLVAACGGGDDASPAPSSEATSSTGPDDGTTPADDDADDAAAEDRSTDAAGDGSTDAAGELRWARADLGFVSAYVLARGNTAAIVDTGVAGSAAAIGESLGTLGLTYDDVDHVILTHHHGDHAGSIGEVLEMAAGATVYAGEADLDQISAESIVGLAGGEDVFGLEMLPTPGHTAGHVAVIDHTAGLLVAGDALWTENGGAAEGPAQFFDDIPGSQDSIRQLAQLSFNTLLVGHGEPIEGAADTAVAALADSFG
ncbi:MAG: MBL fold metallo-hydrolase [Actinomycetota bacterium]